MEPRCYTLVQVLQKLQLTRRSFERLRKAGRIPFDELRPRLGHKVRYRQVDVDRYLSGAWERPRLFARGGER